MLVAVGWGMIVWLFELRLVDGVSNHFVAASTVEVENVLPVVCCV